MSLEVVRPLEAFRTGAIPAVTHELLSRKILELHYAFPWSRSHRNATRQLGGEFVYAQRLSEHRNQWLVLVRFGRVLESRFGFVSEIPLLYVPFDDVQVRQVDSLAEYVDQLPEDRRSVSSSVCFVSAQDPNLIHKSEQWSRPGRVLIPLSTNEDFDPDALLKSIAKMVYSVDLFSMRGAVSGNDFYGRARLINAVLDDIRRRQVPGIFGMRKSGKTSLIHQIINSTQNSRDAESKRRVFVYQDLEHLSGFNDGDPVAELVRDLRDSIHRNLKEAGLRTREIAELSHDAGLLDFRQALDTLLRKLQQESDAELIVVLDEIEYLCPPGAETALGAPNTQKVPQLFGVLRKLVQERSNFGLVISGLSSASIEASELFGRTNPLFSFAHSYFLGAFTDEEGQDLLRGIGRKLGLSWSGDAVASSLAETGGSPMLLRELGSTVFSKVEKNRLDVAHIERPEVIVSLDEWRRNISSNLREIVIHLQKFYPEEFALVDLLMTSEHDFRELAYDFPDQVRRLENLGVIEVVGDTWAPSRILQLSWELVNRRSVKVPLGAPPTLAEIASLPIKDLVTQDEGRNLEKKAVAFFNEQTGNNERKQRDVVVRAVASMMNTEGGSVLIGVHDLDGQVLGIANDIKVASQRRDKDGFYEALTTCLCEAFGASVVSSRVRIRFEEIEDKVVCCISVQRGEGPVYVDEKLYSRTEGTTRALKASEIHGYIQSTWKVV